MSVTTTLATVVRREHGYSDLTLPVSGGPPTPTGEYDDLPQENPHQITTSGAIAIACSSVSLFLALFTIYWFIRMRRRFRHNLIMLLIAGNLWRSLWRLLFPVVEYIKEGVFPTDSAFCQATGFFTTQAVEAVDSAILLIAIHSALSVFSKNAGHRQGGLYPYRGWAFAYWLLFPILISSLAYANPNHRGGYTAQGSICYLPSRPYTFINLTWVPRYFVAAVVFIVYPTIYIYATHKSHQHWREIMVINRMQTYEKPPWHSRILSWCGRRMSGQHSQQQQHLMTAKEIRNSRRGLRLRRNQADNLNHSQTPYSSRPYPLDSALVLEAGGVEASAHHPRLPDGGFGFPTYELQELSRQGTTKNKSQPQDLNSFDAGQDIPKPKPTMSDDSNALSREDTRTTTTTTTMTDASTSAAVDFAQGVAGIAEELEAPQTNATEDKRRDSAVDLPIYKQSRRTESVHSRQTTSAPFLTESRASTISVTNPRASSVMSQMSQMSQTATQNDVPRMVATNEMGAQHERMRRQLRYLFLYPATYILLYIPSFVSHILRSRESYYSDPSFVLSAFVISSSSIQAGVYCVLFSWIEKPWRHIPGSDGSFLRSFDCLSIRKRKEQGKVQDPADVRERLEQQLSYLERLDQRSLASSLAMTTMHRPRKSISRPAAAERYWWEQFEDDGTSTGRRSSKGSRRVSFADGKSAFDDEEDRRGRERRRRVSFPDEYGIELEKEIPLPRSESYTSDAGSRSSRSSSNRRKTVSVQDEAYRFVGRNESSKRRRNSFADGVGAFDDEDRRGRERRRRMSFPDEYGSDLEREIPLQRSESYTSDARSRSSRSRSNRRKTVSVQDEAYRFVGRNESPERRRNSPKVAARDEGGERFDHIPLNDDEEGKKEDDEDEEFPPEPRIVETHDHG